MYLISKLFNLINHTQYRGSFVCVCFLKHCLKYGLVKIQWASRIPINFRAPFRYTPQQSPTPCTKSSTVTMNIAVSLATTVQSFLLCWHLSLIYVFFSSLTYWESSLEFICLKNEDINRMFSNNDGWHRMLVWQCNKIKSFVLQLCNLWFKGRRIIMRRRRRRRRRRRKVTEWHKTYIVQISQLV